MTARLARMLITAALVAGCSGAAPTPTASPTPLTHVLAGTFTLIGASHWGGVPGTPGRCQGLGGYADVKAGQSVTVRDQANAIIATGSTEWQAVTADHDCQFAFTIRDVPDVPFYSIEVGHRGALTYSRADLDGKGWKLDLTLGS